MVKSTGQVLFNKQVSTLPLILGGELSDEIMAEIESVHAGGTLFRFETFSLLLQMMSWFSCRPRSSSWSTLNMG